MRVTSSDVFICDVIIFDKTISKMLDDLFLHDKIQKKDILLLTETIVKAQIVFDTKSNLNRMSIIKYIGQNSTISKLYSFANIVMSNKLNMSSLIELYELNDEMCNVNVLNKHVEFNNSKCNGN
jgi:hypothetical protein